MYQLIDKFFIILMTALLSSDGPTVRRFSPILFHSRKNGIGFC